MMKRGPVPEVRARPRCVTPKALRVSRIKLPSCWGVRMSIIPVREHYIICESSIITMFPFGNIAVTGRLSAQLRSCSGTLI